MGPCALPLSDNVCAASDLESIRSEGVSTFAARHHISGELAIENAPAPMAADTSNSEVHDRKKKIVHIPWLSISLCSVSRTRLSKLRRTPSKRTNRLVSAPSELKMPAISTAM